MIASIVTQPAVPLRTRRATRATGHPAIFPGRRRALPKPCLVGRPVRPDQSPPPIPRLHEQRQVFPSGSGQLHPCCFCSIIFFLRSSASGVQRTVYTSSYVRNLGGATSIQFK
ncbi:hypothetical protein BO94DRAFT_115497 [Aspergillus sclerotioniger CBS 115572]|uniref:Uncharacterized protein n=1 Tax=Aspergillus sclerotioniger CBS 115572 TaxID=1450535 RepID=A0A317WBK1_9EURO|nr:hypothetical protein BO94DRAFT_115497 [Aspergillus sclerotioniger CBS 115572]PWY83814.1 hypothetical protein BO94DRAFT_115497 [Aspergillus sclerotioniger CBS 115572]